MRAILLFLAFALPVSAADYYIDWNTGADTNAGTKVAPFKRHPQMNGWAGGAFTVSPGDNYYFKGGVTWPNAAMSLLINVDGEVDNRIYYGIDETWYEGDQYVSWTDGVGNARQNFNYPVLDAEGLTITDARSFAAASNTRNNVIAVQADYITIHGLHSKGPLIQDRPEGSNPDAGFDHTLRAYQSVGLIVEDCYFSDWVVATTLGGDVGGPKSGDDSDDSLLLNCRIKGPDGDLGEIDPQWITASGGRFFGAGVQGFHTVRGCDISQSAQGVWILATPYLLEGNIIHDIGWYTDSAAHENTIWVQKTGVVRDNVFQDSEGVFYFIPGRSSSIDETLTIYNNVFQGALGQINLTNQEIDVGQDVTLRFLNNTCAAAPQLGTDKVGHEPLYELTIQNNHMVTTNPDGFAVINLVGLGSNYTNSDNAVQTPTSANTAGMNEANLYQPQTEQANLLDLGVDLSSLMDSEDRLGTPRPRGAAWDVGAYEYGSTMSATSATAGTINVGG